MTSTLPYRILLKDSQYYPQLNETNFGTGARGARAYATEDGARKFLRKQATNRLRLSLEYFKKYGKQSLNAHPDEQAWLNNIDTAELIVVPDEIVEPVKHRHMHEMVMKYVVLKSEDEQGNIHELPIMFPYVLIHKEMKECGWRALMKSEHSFIECVGAGFCSFTVLGDGSSHVTCYGESESLGIQSRYELDNLAFARNARNQFSTITERRNANQSV